MRGRRSADRARRLEVTAAASLAVAVVTLALIGASAEWLPAWELTALAATALAALAFAIVARTTHRRDRYRRPRRHTGRRISLADLHAVADVATMPRRSPLARDPQRRRIEDFVVEIVRVARASSQPRGWPDLRDRSKLRRAPLARVRMVDSETPALPAAH